MQTTLTEFQGWTLRIRKPETAGPYPVAMLLHGWMGTEDVMWVFANALPANTLIIAPRAPHYAPNGYSWVPERVEGLSSYDMLAPAVDALTELTYMLSQFYHADFRQIHLMGFSQGAATAYAWTAAHPEQVKSLAALAGFVPPGTETQLKKSALHQMPIFMAHGSQDEIISIENMRQGAAMFEKYGARVTVCEDDVGHKLGANCRRGLAAFYAKIFPTN